MTLVQAFSIVWLSDEPMIGPRVASFHPLTLVPRMGMGGLAGYAEAFGEFADGVVVQLVVLEKSLPRFTHGNTHPGHGHQLLEEEVLPVS